MTGGFLSLGKGRLSGACLIGDENVVVVKVGGVLRKKRLLPGRKIVDDGVIGYADDGFVFAGGTLLIGPDSFEEEQ